MKTYIEHINTGFNFQGVQITNPKMDETGRFEVKPKEYYGSDYYEFLDEAARKVMSDIDKSYNRNTCMSLDKYFCEFEFTVHESETIMNLLNKF